MSAFIKLSLKIVHNYSFAYPYHDVRSQICLNTLSALHFIKYQLSILTENLVLSHQDTIGCGFNQWWNITIFDNRAWSKQSENGDS